jgi:ribosomal protein S18 acetylase RimI-like enzyme
MALDRPTPPSEVEVRVQRVPGSVLDSAVEAAWKRARPEMGDEEARQLVARRVLSEGACAVSYHAVQLNGSWVSRCECYQLGGTAQIDAVMTDPPYEGRGLARAVILNAVEHALRAGAEFVFLRTNADDWPQHLYRRLGFRDLGTVHTLFRALDGAPWA